VSALLEKVARYLSERRVRRYHRELVERNEAKQREKVYVTTVDPKPVYPYLRGTR
jgi:hypothetical protein